MQSIFAAKYRSVRSRRQIAEYRRQIVAVAVIIALTTGP